MLSLTVFVTFFAPAEAMTAAGGWKWQATLIAPESDQAVQLPSSLFVDEHRKRYYVAESAGNRLLSFDRQGGFLNAFSAGGDLQTPYDLVRDDEGLIWVVEKGRNSLTSIDLKGQEVTPHILTDQGKNLIPDRLDYRDRRFYALDRMSGGIARLNKSLEVEQWFRCQECEGAFVDFKIKPSGEIWALTRKDHRVVWFDSDGGMLGGYQVEEHVPFPASLALGPAGNVYVLDRHEGRIAVFNSTGEFKYAFLTKGQSRGQLYYPSEILFDPWGNLVVVEEGNGRAEIFSR